MKKISSLIDFEKSTSKKTRFGRGVGSGKGRTSGRGHKGQKSRSNGSYRAFEGGQTSIFMRTRKRGFLSVAQRNDTKPVSVTTDSLSLYLENVPSDFVMNKQKMYEVGIIKNPKNEVRIIAGKFKLKISPSSIEADYFTKGAISIIESFNAKTILIS
jgi:large subunit ribosomal protein L15